MPYDHDNLQEAIRQWLDEWLPATPTVHWLDYWCTLESDASRPLLDEIIRVAARRRLNLGNRRSFKAHLAIIIANLFRTAINRPEARLAYSRRPNTYSKFPRPPGVGYRGTVRVVDALHQLDLIENEKGINTGNRGDGVSSRIRARSSLLSLCERHRIAEAQVQQLQAPFIVLKDERKRVISFSETVQTEAMREVLRSYNAALATADIGLSGEAPYQPDFHNIHVYRVFNNGSFEQGGRFYDPWWQGEKRLRPHIRINGNATVQFDYGSLVAHQAYSLNGLRYHELYNDDPYDLPGCDATRNVRKQCFIVMLNTLSRSQAARALGKWISKEGLCPSMGTATVRTMMDATLRKHERIRDLFFHPTGLGLQYQDSCMAEFIIKRFLEADSIVLTIHDGFIAEENKSEFLQAVMAEALEAHHIISRPAIKIVAP